MDKKCNLYKFTIISTFDKIKLKKKNTFLYFLFFKNINEWALNLNFFLFKKAQEIQEPKIVF